MDLDEFLLRASFILGVTREQLENEYYMVDIPDLLKMKQDKELADRLTLLNLLIASNNRVIEDRNYQDMVQNLIPGEKNNRNKFNREAIEKLRSMS